MKRFFVDTGAWYALADKSDPDHPDAVNFLKHNSLPLATTNFVLDETVTLLRVRLGWKAAHDFGEKIRESSLLSLIRVEEEDERQAWEIFAKYKDQDFSYTDCTSFAVMNRVGIDTAFAFDRHFQAMKFHVVPVR